MTNELITCLEQKTILLVKILDITKQIEVRCGEPNVDLEDFPATRGSYMHRYDMLCKVVDRLVEQLPCEEKDRIKQILTFKVLEKDCNEDEIVLLHLAKKSHDLYRRAAAIDKAANTALTIQLKSIKEKMYLSRRNKIDKKDTSDINSAFHFI